MKNTRKSTLNLAVSSSLVWLQWYAFRNAAERETHMAIKIYHNPQCSKSRATLQLLQDQGIEAEIVEYLKTPPSRHELNQVLIVLGMEPRELMRKNEPEYKEANLDNADLSREDLIQAIRDRYTG